MLVVAAIKAKSVRMTKMLLLREKAKPRRAIAKGLIPRVRRKRTYVKSSVLEAVSKDTMSIKVRARRRVARRSSRQ